MFKSKEQKLREEIANKNAELARIEAKKAKGNEIGAGKMVAYALIALFAFVLLKSCGSDTKPAVGASVSTSEQTTTNEPSSAPEVKQDVSNTELPSDLYDAYQKADYPRMFAKFGSKWMADASKGKIAAALVAANSGAFKSLDSAEISESDSTKANKKFFVNGTDLAGNVKQMRYDASDLKDAKGHWFTKDTIGNTTVEDETSKRASATAAINVREATKEAIREHIRANGFTGKIEFHDIAGYVQQPLNQGGARGIMDFDTINDFNAKRSYRAEVEVDGLSGKAEVYSLIATDDQ